jgi:hypothetical protein
VADGSDRNGLSELLCGCMLVLNFETETAIGCYHFARNTSGIKIINDVVLSIGVAEISEVWSTQARVLQDGYCRAQLLTRTQAITHHAPWHKTTSSPLRDPRRARPVPLRLQRARIE